MKKKGKVGKTPKGDRLESWEKDNARLTKKIADRKKEISAEVRSAKAQKAESSKLKAAKAKNAKLREIYNKMP